jgi:hypothetical protein
MRHRQALNEQQDDKFERISALLLFLLLPISSRSSMFVCLCAGLPATWSGTSTRSSTCSSSSSNVAAVAQWLRCECGHQQQQ